MYIYMYIYIYIYIYIHIFYYIPLLYLFLYYRRLHYIVKLSVENLIEIDELHTFFSNIIIH